MLSILPKKFHSHGDCGCSSPSYPQTGCATPVCGSSGALICDNRYFSLATAPAGQLLVVPAGSNCQAFLRQSGARGFIFYASNEVSIVDSPSLSLPLINPAVEGVYPTPAAWKYITIGTGADPAGWRHVAAPTAGAYVLQSKNGEWILTDAGSIPGINEIGNSGATTPKGGMMMLVETTPGVWVVRRLAVQHNRVVVGDIDGDTGEQGFKVLAGAVALTHPIGKFQDLRLGTLTCLDDAGTEIAGGMPQAYPTGVGAITDSVRMTYSPGEKKLFKAPPITTSFDKVAVVSASTLAPATYGAMPSGHGAGTSQTYHYPKVRIDFMCSLSAVENLAFGVFRDGALIQEFSIASTLDVAIFYLDEGVVPGAHTYDVRWKKISGTNQSIIQLSALLVTTLLD